MITVTYRDQTTQLHAKAYQTVEQTVRKAFQQAGWGDFPEGCSFTTMRRGDSQPRPVEDPRVYVTDYTTITVVPPEPAEEVT